MKKKPGTYKNFFLTFFKHCSIIACLLMLVLWSTASSAAPIKIGEINPLSGRFAKQGQETHQGVEVAVTETTSKAFVERFCRMFNRQPNTTNMHGYTSARALCGKASLASWRNQELKCCDRCPLSSLFRQIQS